MIETQQESFSTTGEMTPEQKKWCETANPSYALWNCQRTAMATAIMLETGEMRPISVIPIPKFSLDESSHLIPPLKGRISSCFSLERERLKKFMLFLGKQGHKIHAIVSGAHWLCPLVGHLFNCAVVKNGEDYKFKIIDSYGGSYTKQAEESPDEFLNNYRPSLYALLFHEEEIDLQHEYKLMDLEENNPPSKHTLNRSSSQRTL